MKRRFAVYLSFSFLIALLLIGSATITQIVRVGHSAADFNNWIFAQQSEPVLWLVDVAAISLVVMMFRAGIEVAHSQQQTRAYAELAAEQLRTQEDHHRQVEALIARNVQLEKHTTELEELNHERALRIGEMEMQVEAQQQHFEQEARHLTEQALRALEGQVNANTLQMEAINMAMQYQRAELKELRHGLRVVQTGQPPAQDAQLSSAELAALFEEHTPPAITSEEPADLPAAPASEAALPALPEEPWREEPLPPLALTTVYGEGDAAATGPLSPEDAPPLSVASEPPAEAIVTNDTPTAEAPVAAPAPDSQATSEAVADAPNWALGTGRWASVPQREAVEPAADISLPEETGQEDFDAQAPPPAYIFLLHDAHRTKTDEPSEVPISAKALLDAIPETVPEDIAALYRGPQTITPETPETEETLPPPEKPEKSSPTSSAQADAAAAPRDWHFKI